MPKGGLTASIEQFDMHNREKGWREMRIPASRNELQRPRQMPGIVQINQNEILIMGGFAISSALKGLF